MAEHCYLPIENLRYRMALITGAATSIGRVHTFWFEKLSARVIIGMRGQQGTEKMTKELSEKFHGKTVIEYDLHLSYLVNIKKFARIFNKLTSYYIMLMLP